MECADFTKNLYLQCVKEKPGNVIISPLSVSSALVLLSQSAGDNTYDQLKQALNLDNDKSVVANQFFEHRETLEKNAGETILSIANRIYVQQGNQLSTAFQGVATSKFKSGIETLNFDEPKKSADTINQFVEEKTTGKIKDLFKPDAFSSDTQSVLVNAIYFKGTWEKPFDKNRTRKEDFYNSETEKIQIDFMCQKNDFNVAYVKELHATIIEFKYANSKMAFEIVLPDSVTGLPELEARLKDFDWAKITDKLESENCFVLIPKFKVEYEIKLNEALKNLGLTEIFSDTANLRGMFDPEIQLKVSDVVHKAVIEIDEEGSTAACVTGTKLIQFSMPSEYSVCVPFMYFIRETTTNTIIFTGRIARFD